MGDFFIHEPPRARIDDPDTSQDGIEGPHDLSKLQNDIVSTLRLHGNGLTCGELAIFLGKPRDSISPRMRTLENHNRIRATELRRSLPKGRPQIVWVIVL